MHAFEVAASVTAVGVAFPLRFSCDDDYGYDYGCLPANARRRPVARRVGAWLLCRGYCAVALVSQEMLPDLMSGWFLLTTALRA